MGAARMGVGNRDLLLQSAAVLESDDDTRAVILVERCRLGEAPRPLRVLHRAHLAPQAHGVIARRALRSEEHTSELQSLMRISYAVFCLKKKKKKNNTTQHKLYSTKLNHLITSISNYTTI